MINVSYHASHDDHIIIVGANSGIGLELIQLCRASHVQVVGIDIQPTSKLNLEDGMMYHSADPLSKDKLAVIADELSSSKKHITGLVNLSGTIASFQSIQKIDLDQWDETYDISFKSTLHSCQVFTPLLRSSAPAAIVNMSSGLAFIGQKNYGPYSAAKAAVVSLTKTLAAELGPHIRVNTLAPGAVDTPFIYGSDGSTRFDLEGYRSRVPTGDIAKPQEIAHVIMYLLSDGASHINGECIHVNGGVG